MRVSQIRGCWDVWRLIFNSIDDDEDDVGYHKLVDELESKWKLLNVFQSDGHQIAEGVALGEEDVLKNIDFSGIEPDDEESEGWTGNEGCTATHLYHRTCAVFLPRVSGFVVLTSCQRLSMSESKSTLTRF